MPTSPTKEINETIRLKGENLNKLPEGIIVPTYDRSNVTVGIVHMSVGGFHRAHQAVYTDNLLAQDGQSMWGICGVGLLDFDKSMYDALVPQDTLYTILERQGGEEKARVIGSIVSYIFAPTERAKLLDTLTASSTKIVSLTITERGYWADPVTKLFNPTIPEIAADLSNPTEPRTAVGIIVEALKLRRDLGVSPFTVLSCDNIEDNGSFTRRLVLSYAQCLDAELANWIEENVTFPSTMVDRITPMTTDADRIHIEETYGYRDAWPVVCESFTQWVIEDAFCNDRPAWERFGAQMVHDVKPYEFMKIRLLNASHSLMVYLGSLLGYEYIHEIIQDKDISALIAKIMDDEITPTLKPVPGIDITEYKRTLIERFSNEAIRDQARRVAMDGSQKIPQCVMPTVNDILTLGKPANGIALCLAGWIVFLDGKDEDDRDLPLDDPLANIIRRQARQTINGEVGILSNKDIFGDILQKYPDFSDSIQHYVSQLKVVGVRKLILDGTI
jgi:mannitol 2-dehydrogenase